MVFKTKKKILIAACLVFVAGLSIGFYFYNKGPADIKHSSGLPVKATDLYSVFMSDSVIAKEKYTDKILEVKGEITEISLNNKKQQVILFKTGIPLAYVNCTLEEPAAHIKPSDQIAIKGICSGIGQGDADLGIQGDVYLTRCFVALK